MILNFLFLVLLVSANLCFFLMLNVNFDTGVNVNKKKITFLVIPIVSLILLFLIFNTDAYLASFNATVALIGLMYTRFLFRKLLSVPHPGETRINRALRKFGDKVVFPFFVLFVSFFQFMRLIIWQ